MKQYKISELVHELDISRARIYQIIKELFESKKIRKDASGHYIIDATAVKEIKNYAEINTTKLNQIDKKVDKSIDGRQVSKTSIEVVNLRQKLDNNEKLLDAKDETIRMQQDYINSLQKEVATLHELVSQAQKLTQNAQQLNLADKDLKKLTDNTNPSNDKPNSSTNKRFFERIFSKHSKPKATKKPD